MMQFAIYQNMIGLSLICLFFANLGYYIKVSSYIEAIVLGPVPKSSIC